MSHHRIARFEVLLEVYNLGPQMPPRNKTEMFGIAAGQKIINGVCANPPPIPLMDLALSP